MSHDHFHILFVALFLLLFLGVYFTGVFYKAYYDQKIKNLWEGLGAVTEEINKGFTSLNDARPKSMHDVEREWKREHPYGNFR